MLEEMPTKDVLAVANAIPAVNTIVNSYDFIRSRESQCFCLKIYIYIEDKLGIGISITRRNKPLLRAEFDPLRQEAFSCSSKRSGGQFRQVVAVAAHQTALAWCEGECDGVSAEHTSARWDVD